MGMGMITEVTAAQPMSGFLHLLQFGDSGLPVGGFSFSHGLETAIDQRIVFDLNSLQDFILTVMRQTATVDGIALLCAHRAAQRNDIEALTSIDRAVLDRKINEETRLMTVRMGRKLCELASAVVGGDLCCGWLDRIKGSETDGTHPVSMAIALSSLGIERQHAFAVQQYGVATSILGAALRLMRVAFVDTQKILLDTMAVVAPTYDEVADSTIDEMASFAPMIDILAAMHVKAHVRMFMN